MARTPVREERREQILQALYAVMARDGTRGASVSDIASQAGIARGALHYFFESKDEITTSLMRRMGREYVAQLTALLDATEPARAVATLASWHFRGDAESVAQRMSVWIDFWGQAPSHAGIHDAVFEVQEGARALCARAMVLQRPALAALPAPSLRAHAAAILGAIEGALLQWRVARNSDAPFDRRSLGDAVAAFAHAHVASIAISASETASARAA